MSDITLSQAHAAVEAALEKSKEIGAAMDIAVVDAGANSKRSHAWTARGSARSTSR